MIFLSLTLSLSTAFASAPPMDTRVGDVASCVHSYKETQRNVDLCLGGMKQFDFCDSPPLGKNARGELCPQGLAPGEILFQLAPSGAEPPKLALIKNGKMDVYAQNSSQPLRVGNACYLLQERTCPNRIAETGENCSGPAASKVAVSQDDVLADLLSRVNTDLRGLLKEFERGSPQAEHVAASERYRRLLGLNEASCREAIQKINASPGFNKDSRLGIAIRQLAQNLDSRLAMSKQEKLPATTKQTSPGGKKDGRD